MTRLAAWSLLRSDRPRPLAAVADVAAEFGLDDRDRGLLRAIVGTCLRRRGTLRALVRRFAKGKPSADMAAHLHVGFAQLFFLDRVPDHAAVSETVRAAADSLGLSKGRYVNGVLREAIRNRRTGASGDPQRDLVGRDLWIDAPFLRDPEEHPYLWIEDALNIPSALAKRWAKRIGREETERLARVFLNEPGLSVRVVRGEREEVRAALPEAGLLPSGHPSLLVGPSSAAQQVVASELFQSGALTIQGECALRAAELVGAREGERILDLCAAPGGKTAVLAATGASVLASDRSEARCADLRGTLERLGLAERVEIRVADGAAELEEDFDAVLVDAPCSNTGVLGARAAARWRFGPKEHASLRDVQGRLLEEAAARVRPGGRLVWSTCSLEPEENGQRIKRFLAEHPAFELMEETEERPVGIPDVPPPAEGAGGEDGAPASEPPLPPDGPVDGGYRALLRRKDDA